jgi:hypothetical protein
MSLPLCDPTDPVPQPCQDINSPFTHACSGGLPVRPCIRATLQTGGRMMNFFPDALLVTWNYPRYLLQLNLKAHCEKEPYLVKPGFSLFYTWPLNLLHLASHFVTFGLSCCYTQPLSL